MIGKIMFVFLFSLAPCITPVLASGPGDYVVIDNFNDSSFSSLALVNIRTDSALERSGAFSAAARADDPTVTIDHVDFSGTDYNILLIRFLSEKSPGPGSENFEVSWYNEDNVWDAKVITTVTRDGTWQNLALDMSGVSTWNGKAIKKLCIKPYSTLRTRFALDYIHVLRPEIVWPMNNAGEISLYSDLNYSFSNGIMRAATIGDYTGYVKFTNSCFNATHFNTIEFLMKTTLSQNKNIRLYVYNAGWKSLVFDQQTPAANEWRTYSYYMAGNTAWTGTVDALRNDFIPGETQSWSLELDYFKAAYRLPPPQLLCPADDHSETYSGGPAFSWVHSADPGGHLQAARYELQISTNISFTSAGIIEAAADLTEPGYTATNCIAARTYYWRVRAIDNLGKPSAWSDRYLFVKTGTDANQLAAPVLITPANNSVGYMHHPDFLWEPVDSASSLIRDHYLIEIAADSSFSNIIASDEVYNERYVPDVALAAGDHWWRACAVDHKGGKGSWSSSCKLTISDPPADHVYSVPANASYSTFKSTMVAAVKNPPAKVLLAENSTYFWDNPDGMDIFTRSGVENLILDGRGAKIIITNTIKGFLYLKNSKHIEVKNLFIDYSPLPYAAGTVVAVDPANKTFDFEIWPGYPALTNNCVFQLGVTINKGALKDPAVPGRLKPGVSVRYKTDDAAITPVGGNRYRIPLLNAATGWEEPSNWNEYITEFEVGDTYLFNGRSGGNIFTMKSTDDLTIDNVVAFAAPGVYINAEQSSMIKVLNGGAKIASGRWQSLSAGGMIFINSQVGPWIEGCLMEGLMDDMVGFASKPLYPQSKVSSTVVRLYDYGSPGLLKTNDTILIHNGASGAFKGSFMVSAIAVTTNVYNGQTNIYYDVTLATDPGSITACTKPGQGFDGDGDHFYVKQRMFDKTVVRHNRFMHNRRNGILWVSGSDAVAEHNEFQGTALAAIYMQNEIYPSVFISGLHNQNVLFRNNVIKQCGLSIDNGAIQDSIHVSMMNSTETTPVWNGQQGLRFLDNQIFDCERGMSISLVTNAILMSNIFAAKADNDGFCTPAPHFAIEVSHTDGIDIARNAVMDRRALTCTIGVDTNNCTDCTVENNLYPEDLGQ